VQVTILENISSRDPWNLACLSCKRKQDDVRHLCICVYLLLFLNLFMLGSHRMCILQGEEARMARDYSGHCRRSSGTHRAHLGIRGLLNT
jgi:hypothetical protein